MRATPQLTLSDISRYPLPGTSLPSCPSLSHDGKALVYLDSAPGDPCQTLWSRDLDSGAAREIFDPRALEQASGAEESLEEALLKERRRERTSGLSRYARLPDSPWLLVTLTTTCRNSPTDACSPSRKRSASLSSERSS